MKTILVFVWTLPLIGFAALPSDDYRKALSETGITSRPFTPNLGEPIFDLNYLSDIRKLPSSQKEKLASQLTQIIPRLVQEPSASTVSKEVGPVKSGTSPLLGILILQEIGNDVQKVEAFRNLDRYGDWLSDACRVLATCEDSGGIQILTQYAERQFVELTKEGSKNPEGQAREKPDVNVYTAMIALAGAHHSDGPIAAEKLRDRLIDLCKIRLNATRFTAVEKDLVKNMEEASRNRENLIRKNGADNKRNLKTGRINTETPSTFSDNLSRATTSEKWFWPGISITAILLIFAFWILINRAR